MLVLILLGATADAQPALSVFSPLVGHCFAATVAKGTTDRHCFQAMYGGAHVRDDHVVTSGGRDVYAGSTVYSAEGDGLTMTYFNSLGGVGRGTLRAEGPEIRFRLAMRASPQAAVQSYEPRWQLDDGGYTVTSASGTQPFTRDDR